MGPFIFSTLRTSPSAPVRAVLPAEALVSSAVLTLVADAPTRLKRESCGCAKAALLQRARRERAHALPTAMSFLSRAARESFPCAITNEATSRDLGARRLLLSLRWRCAPAAGRR
jgi:hypothetical protein